MGPVVRKVLEAYVSHSLLFYSTTLRQQAWEISGNFQISGKFVTHSPDFQDVLRYDFCLFLHIFKKHPKDSFSCLHETLAIDLMFNVTSSMDAQVCTKWSYWT